MEADPIDIKVGAGAQSLVMYNEYDCTQVVAPLREIEFLNLDDVPSDDERSYLYNCVKSDHGNYNEMILKKLM